MSSRSLSNIYLLSLGLTSAFIGGCGNEAGKVFTSGGGSNGSTSTAAGTGGAGNATTGGNTTTGNATTGSSTTGIVVPPTTTGAGGGTLGDGGCAGETEGTKQVPTDIFIMLDRSGSMECPASDDKCQGGGMTPPTGSGPTRWKAVTDAINAFVASPDTAGIGVGIGVFGLESGGGGGIPGADVSCTVGDYATPKVAIGFLPGNGAPITAAIAATTPLGGTPTTPALQGAINYAKSYAMATPDRSAAVVLVTDGVPTGCMGSNSIPQATAVARTAFAGTPSIKTFVVGLGDTQALETIANAGSGGMTPFFKASGDVTAELIKVLKQVSGSITCEYALPKVTKSGQPLDYNQVNLEIKIGENGTPTLIGRVQDAAACATVMAGWYYDVDPKVGKPTKITLCPNTCEPLKTNPGSTVSLQIGCGQIPPH